MENIWSSDFFHPLLWKFHGNFTWKMDGTWPASSNRKGPFFQRLWSSLFKLPQRKPRPPQDPVLWCSINGYEDVFFAQFEMFETTQGPKANTIPMCFWVVESTNIWHILSCLMVKPVFFLWFWNWLWRCWYLLQRVRRFQACQKNPSLDVA